MHVEADVAVNVDAIVQAYVVADADRFARHYLFVDRPGEPRGATVAALFDDAAAALRAHGDVVVHHIALDITDATSAGVSLSVYYDRVERRRTPRTTGNDDVAS